MASKLIALFDVDPEWTQEHLLPLLDWQENPNESAAMWQSFLMSPRCYLPLFTHAEFKTNFLALEAFHKEGFSKNFPLEALTFLDKIIHEQQPFSKDLLKDLPACLNEIISVVELEQDPRFMRLKNLCQRLI